MTAFVDYKRDGLKKLIQTAKVLCQLIIKFEPIIREKYAANPGIISFLDGAIILCDLVGLAQSELSAMGSDDPVPPVDTTTIGGINPLAPPSGVPSVI